MIVLIIIYAILFILNCLCNEKNRKMLNIFTVLLLSISSAFVVPTREMDLYRHYQTLDNFRFYGLEYFQMFRYTKSLPIYAGYFYLISLLGYNGFLPMISSAITYGCMLHILTLAKDDFGFSNKEMKFAYLLMIFLNSYIDMLCIRNLMIFAIGALILYYDIVRKKSTLLCFLGYILITLIHYSGVFIILLRIIFWLFSKRKIYWPIIFIMSVWTLFQSQIYSVLIRFDHITFIHLINSTFKLYLSEEDAIRNIYFSLIRIFLVLLSLIIGVRLNNKFKNELSSNEREYIKFSNALCLFTLGTGTTDYLFLRLVMLVAIIACPVIVKYFLLKKEKSNLFQMEIYNAAFVVVFVFNILSIFYFHYRVIFFWG